MVRSISIGWVLTLLLFFWFIAGGVYTFNQIKSSNHERAFNTCMDRAGQSGAGWKMQSQVALCQDLYTTVAGGRYGPQSDATIRLASMKRPIFSMQY